MVSGCGVQSEGGQAAADPGYVKVKFQNNMWVLTVQTGTVVNNCIMNPIPVHQSIMKAASPNQGLTLLLQVFAPKFAAAHST